MLTGRAASKRRKLSLLVVPAIAVGLAVVPSWVSAAGPVTLSPSTFEVDEDANLVENDSALTDWLVGGSGTALRSDVNPKKDDDSGSNDSAFSNGTKEDSAVPTLDNGGIPPNKSDLKYFGVLTERVGVKTFLNVFWTRVQDPSGTTNMDFEFNKGQAGLKNNPNGSPQLIPVRAPGDLLLTYDLSNGGTNAQIRKRFWTGSQWGPAELLTSSQAIGTINTTAIDLAGSGGAGGVGPLSPRTFGEATVDLDALKQPGSDPCTTFGSAYLKSRSSDSFTAALKDFIPPKAVNVTNCGTVTIHKTDNNGPLGGATFSLYKDNAPVGGTKGVEDTLTNPELKCTTASVTAAGPPATVKGDCSINNVGFGDYWLVETVIPANHTGADPIAFTLDAANTSFVRTINNPLQTGSVSITKADDGLPVPARLGDVTFTLYADNSPFGPGTARGNEDTATTYTCTTATATAAGPPATVKGECSIGSVLLGKYWIVEGTPPTGHVAAADQHVDVAVSNQNYAKSFVNPRQFKVITIVCKVADNSLYPSKVSYNGASLPATNNTLATPPGGVTAAQLCGISNATTTVQHGTGHTSSISIPQ